MNFYIPPFWCGVLAGVLATVICEFLAIVVCAVIKIIKNKRGNENEK